MWIIFNGRLHHTMRLKDDSCDNAYIEMGYSVVPVGKLKKVPTDIG